MRMLRKETDEHDECAVVRADCSLESALPMPSGGTLAAATVPVPESPPCPSGKPASDVITGATARAAAQAAIHPLDTLKVRMQVRSRGRSTCKLPRRLLSRPKGSVLSMLNAAASAGRDVAGLYQGVLGAACGAGIACGTYFAFYTAAANIIAKKTSLPTAGVAFFSGGIAAVGSSIVKVPLAVCIRSVQAGVYANAFTAAQSIVAAAGPQGLFAGYVPTLIEDVPDMACRFAGYETLRSIHKAMLKDREPTAGEDFVMGALAGAFAAAVTTPVDVIKTNMMCTAAMRPTMASAARTVMAAEGLKGFARGVGPRAVSNGINSAVFFTMFEFFRGCIAQHSCPRKAPEKVIGTTAGEKSMDALV
ncbi:unnamed protein product [Ostreobium quekettii]|uniref:Mitochondrial carrier protein n=1 Tax=Ostreobium quekettii TaxID=121088 RepID=A0A8S1J578_9CHLO|nr:unnamed protein product [Ostreobium quekettii]|eukprot:evm.model.scf_702.3 EVM.evm.TU.scf_702.3   scf_702:51473-52561(-)